MWVAATSSCRGNVPVVGAAQPVVPRLDLPAGLHRLLEDTELVAQAVAHRRDLQCSERVDEAGGQAPQAAVAQAGVRLQLGQRRQVEALALEHALDEGVS